MARRDDDQEPEDGDVVVPDASTDGEPGAIAVGRPPKPITQQVGRVAVIASGAVFLLFALSNWQYVDFSWVFGKTEVLTQGDERISGGVPLLVLLVGAFLLGAVVGAGFVHRRRRVKQRVRGR